MGLITMDKYLEMSINELISIFRGSLIALIPWLDKAKIKWEDGVAYDDWDNIVESLYQNIVCASLVGEVLAEYNIAKYNYYYKDFTSIEFIEVKTSVESREQYVFIGFQSISTYFDSVKVAIINDNYELIRYSNIDYKDTSFSYVKRLGSKKFTINSLKIRL